MIQHFNLRATSLYQRSVVHLTKRNKSLLDVVDRLLDAVESDPYNRSGRHNIKKLHGVELGDGQWRIRAGNYRLRYDIHGEDVILYSFNDRKEAY